MNSVKQGSDPLQFFLDIIARILNLNKIWTLKTVMENSAKIQYCSEKKQNELELSIIISYCLFIKELNKVVELMLMICLTNSNLFL